MCRTCTLTVTGLINSVSPISAFDNPRAINAKTSFSRRDKARTEWSGRHVATHERRVTSERQNTRKVGMGLRIRQERNNDLGTTSVGSYEWLNRARPGGPSKRELRLATPFVIRRVPQSNYRPCACGPNPRVAAFRMVLTDVCEMTGSFCIPVSRERDGVRATELCVDCSRKRRRRPGAVCSMRAQTPLER